jgi:hypothetical protein
MFICNRCAPRPLAEAQLSVGVTFPKVRGEDETIVIGSLDALVEGGTQVIDGPATLHAR